ncbi:hypothetical protein VUR80DRAFT_3682 [Thermomyces stellatus]
MTSSLLLVVFILRNLLPLVLGTGARLCPQRGVPPPQTLVFVPQCHASTTSRVWNLHTRFYLRLAILGLLPLCSPLALCDGHFGGEPVDGPPEATTYEGQGDEVEAVRSEEEDEEEDLECREGGVGGLEEDGAWARGEDGLPELGEEGGCHGLWMIRRLSKCW